MINKVTALKMYVHQQFSSEITPGNLTEMTQWRLIKYEKVKIE
jgi:hypothetical protein